MSEKNGIYQVWHDQRSAKPRIASALGGAQARFPQDYVHVGNVEATGLHDAVEQTTGIGDFFLCHEEWQPWTVKPGTQALVPEPRDTWFSDVIVDPQGQPHRMMGLGGFEASPARERPGWQTQAEVAAEEMAGAAEDLAVMDRACHRGDDPMKALDRSWRDKLPEVIKERSKGPEIG